MIFTFPTKVEVHDLPEIASYAINKHGSKMYGIFPYAHHLQHVFNVVDYFVDDDDLRKAAWTHDLCEDEDVTKEEITLRSNQRVADLTWAVSGFGNNRSEKLQCVIEKIPEVPGSEFLKMADRGCNIQKCLEDSNFSMLKLYAVKEHPLLSKVFPTSGPMRDWLEGLVEESNLALTRDPGKRKRPRP